MDSAGYLSPMSYMQGPNSWGNSILKLMDRLEAMPMGADHISDWTASDPVLQQVQTKVQCGWCDKCPDKSLQPYYVRRDKLSSQNMVVSDNGTGFTSEEFGTFMIKNGILCMKTAPGYPPSNGHVLRSVHIFRDRMKKLEGSKGTAHTKLSRFLLAYRSTTQPKMGLTPGELLFKLCQCT
ncbi:Uncharacterized protein P5673_005548 [Acropora cervicornis]|uniref:Integrase catalytic domain-containing protein n=1 Tax=Acropora cervicornis TaxID=6130 RepID=A0AAD9QYJ8_ACRCE|nr:Uncharacterized protein P5673_005548 [Acropora cervicornis]